MVEGEGIFCSFQNTADTSPHTYVSVENLTPPLIYAAAYVRMPALVSVETLWGSDWSQALSLNAKQKQIQDQETRSQTMPPRKPSIVASLLPKT